MTKFILHGGKISAESEDNRNFMDIYFTGSITGGRDDIDWYQKIVKLLKQYGRLLTEHVADQDLTVNGEIDKSVSEIHDKDLAWLESCQVVVAEVSTISMGVGYEIGRAVEKQKKILCLYRSQEGRRVSPMISGCPDLKLEEYQDSEDLKKILGDFFS